MALTKEFVEAVNNGKNVRVRIMLKDSMLIDPSLNKFEEMLNYAAEKLEGLYDQHDGEVLMSDSSAWNEDYMNQQMVAVVTNFSKERIELLKNIVHKIYGHKVQSKMNEKNKEDSKMASAKANKGPTTIQIAGGIIAGVGAGTLVGGILGLNRPIAIVGGVALVTGITMVILDGNKEN